MKPQATAWLSLVLLCAGWAGCGAPSAVSDGGVDGGGTFDSGLVDSGSDAGVDAGLKMPDPFADRVVRFEPGPGAGFGQSSLPQVVTGPPQGAGAGLGSLDVVSLGMGGIIELEFTDFEAVDGPGVDLLVFENPFSGFVETGVVSVSTDGTTWHTFPCAANDAAGGYPGCAGVHPVYSSPDNDIPPTDPAVAGGDGFDLATLGLSSARFVRIQDTGTNRYYAAPSGGFDLDGVAVVNSRRLDGGMP